MQLEQENILTGYSPAEKSAYLGALASLATADRHADEEELQHLSELATAAGLSDAEAKTILESAEDTSGQYLLKSLDQLKTSNLRYSLITDLIALAKLDDDYTEDEKSNIEKVARYLQVDKNQFSVLDQFVNKAAEQQPTPEEITKPGYVDSLGMTNQFAGAGLNMGSIGKSVLGFLGPMLLGSLAGRALSGNRTRSGGLGGMLGGGLGSMIGGGLGRTGVPGGLGGGLGSLITGLNRSRSSRNLGGMLGRLL
jgi:uncharacterized tellurite resistance protein B-like protein